MTLAHCTRCVLRFRCPDQPGILAGVSSLLAANGWDIREAAIYGDPDSGIFFVRTELASDRAVIADLSLHLAPVIATLALDWEVHDIAEPMPVLIAVSKFNHCLIDLIHKVEIGALPIRIVGVVSNHDQERDYVEWHGIPYHHLPVDRADKAAQERRFLDIIGDSGAELTVLARYMQILSDDFAARIDGRCINIHHSFLPSFKGAKPYHQAKARGVKLIGATAHYVTADLDEGPIIEQDVRRVSHATTADEMVAIGREVEASVLSRAVRWHAEHRVIGNGSQTVVLT
ncbi:MULTISPECIES: formyltetrahydrofolate deformylase [unclassified Sphingomonas]|uniref:formyltetrahydrofolate deformylase n=1 Tax=unclassified Sphingomonas TaxID=196159 RepID=UPI0021509B6C|nr:MULTISPECIES: formyltetrahydrofolate deformylase [unclassified Sphingomonas]MCR5872627.1 formyltetrahydrofolate deformylase [Sphingomonas sp. J344]UUX99089.1 formyltetrahydrofolate deformylase [Sphingomonas sp. J315]